MYCNLVFSYTNLLITTCFWCFMVLLILFATHTKIKGLDKSFC